MDNNIVKEKIYKYIINSLPEDTPITIYPAEREIKTMFTMDGSTHHFVASNGDLKIEVAGLPIVISNTKVDIGMVGEYDLKDPDCFKKITEALTAIVHSMRGGESIPISYRR